MTQTASIGRFKKHALH